MNKIFMKLGWPGALVLLVGFLSTAIYIVVNRAIVENKQIEQTSTSEESTADTSDVEVLKNNNQDNDTYETESAVVKKEEESLIEKQSSLEEKVSGEELVNTQDLKKKSDLLTSSDNDTSNNSAETNQITQTSSDNDTSNNSAETNQITQKSSQDDKLTNNAEEIKELKSSEVTKTEKGLLQETTDGGSQEESETKVDILRVDESGVTVIAGKAEAGTTVKAKVGTEVIGTVESDEDGDFVIVGQISSSEDARELKLLTRDEKKEDKTVGNQQITEPAWVVSSNSFFILPNLFKESDDNNHEEKNVNTVSIIEVKEDDLLLKQDPYPIGVEKVSLDRIKYSSDGTAILFGRCRSDMAVLVYLDNVLHRKVQPANDGSWSLDLGIINPGVYTLRLDEVDGQGTVLSRIESPFKQEAKDLLDKLFAEAITVQPGNSLWRIARRIYGRGIMYMEIYKKNDHLIIDPDLIYPGQVFSLLD